MNDFDLLWKLKAIEIAVAEQLEDLGYIEPKTVFRRAKFLYNQGYMKGIEGWDSAFRKIYDEEKIDAPSTTEKPKIEEDLKEPAKGYKICPKCQEEVPKGWPEHKFKKIGGEPCGYKW